MASPIQSQSSLSTFVNEISNSDTQGKIQGALSLLQNCFNHPVQLEHTMDGYHIQRALMRITKSVKEKFQHLTEQWDTILHNLHNREIPVKGTNPIKIDTTIAEKELQNFTPSFLFREIDLQNDQKRENFVDYLKKIDSVTFQEFFPSFFYHDMLLPNHTHAFCAFDENENIVGGIWGFTKEFESISLFHVWSFSILPQYSQIGLGQSLIDFALRTSFLSGKDFITLNVDPGNQHARNLYEKLNYTPLGEQPRQNKIFMIRSLSPMATAQSFPSEVARHLVKDYVMQNAAVRHLVISEIYRKVFSFFRGMYWSVRNHSLPTVTLPAEQL